MTRSHTVAAIVAAAALFSLTSPARADQLATLRARGRLVVSVKNDANHPHKDPAHYDTRGFEVELAHALAGTIVGDPSKLELRVLARPVRLPMLAAGNVDLVVSMIPVTPENAADVDFSHPYFASGLSLLVRGTAKPTLAGLAGKTVAFRKQSFNNYGGELERIAREHRLPITVRYFATAQQAADAVARGEVAAMGGNFVDLEAFAREHPGFSVDAALLEERTVAVAVKKGEPALMALVNATIDELRRSGQLARLAAKWHLPYLLP